MYQARIPPQKWTLLGSYLGISRLVRGRYSQRYSLGAAAIPPPVTTLLQQLIITVASSLSSMTFYGILGLIVNFIGACTQLTFYRHLSHFCCGCFGMEPVIYSRPKRANNEHERVICFTFYRHAAIKATKRAGHSHLFKQQQQQQLF